MNSRRLMLAPAKAQDIVTVAIYAGIREGVVVDVRFGSKADMCSAKGMSALPPIATAIADLPQKMMSALTPKADIFCAVQLADVCFVPIAN